MLHHHFNQLKTNLELTPYTRSCVSTHHHAIRSSIEHINPTFTTKLIGSLGRQTCIQPCEGVSIDIDILVVLGQFDCWSVADGITPQRAMDQLHKVVVASDRYSEYGPVQESPTITFTYADSVSVELVPAYKDNVGTSPDGSALYPKGRGYWIPYHGKWTYADYDYEQQLITNKNVETGGVLIPAMKMIKAIKRRHFRYLSSFYLDIMATEYVPIIISVLSDYDLPKGYPDILRKFFGVDGVRLFGCNTLSGSLSPPVTCPPFEESVIARKMQEIGERIESLYYTTSEARLIEGWQDVFGAELFPRKV